MPNNCNDDSSQLDKYSIIIKKTKQYAMIDLHGCSPEEAEKIVNHWLLVSGSVHYDQIRFVTGRGNHVNAKGERGTLYHSFKLWIDRSPSKDRVAKCTQHDGYFEISFKSTQIKSSNTEVLETSINNAISENLTEIIKNAEEGQPYYQDLYASLLENGEYVPQDFKKAAMFYEKAAKNNYAPAMHELARCYLHGSGVRQSDREAVKWLKNADINGLVDSIISLGDCYWTGCGVMRDLGTAVSFYAKAAAKFNNPIAMRKLASAYHGGQGVKQSFIKSFEWYKKSADLGDVLAQYNVAVMYELGEGIEKSLQRSFEYYQISAKAGDPDGQFLLGQAYLLGKGTESSEALALFWLETAAANGSGQANHLLAQMTNGSQQTKYLNKSASVGYLTDWLHSERQQILAMTKEEFYTQFGKKIRQAFDLPIMNIIALDDYSQFMIIDSMLSDGPLKYRKKAFEVLKILAGQDCIFSLRRLVEIYKRGSKELGVSKNIQQSIDYIRKASDLGDSKSDVLLGNHYEQGYEVKKSSTIAMEYYQKAMKNNNPSGYFYAGFLLLKNLSKMNDMATGCQYLYQAIELEKSQQNIRALKSGFIDIYEPITEKATDFLQKFQAFADNKLPEKISLIDLNDEYYAKIKAEPEFVENLEESLLIDNSNDNIQTEIPTDPEVIEPEETKPENQGYYCLVM